MGIYPVQQAFNGGEISPLLTARADQLRYQTGALRMRNVVPMAQGPATRRPGTRWLNTAADETPDAPVRLVPFVFSAVQARMLEFAPGKVRVWMPSGALVASGGAPYVVASPYTAADLPSMRVAQSADVVYIACPNHPPRKLSRHADNDWRFETIAFMPQTPTPTGVTGALTGGSGSDVVYRYVVSAVDATTGQEGLPCDPVTVRGPSLSSTVYVHLAWAAVPNALEYRIYKEKSGVFGFIGRAISGAVIFDDKNIAADAEDTPQNAKNPFTTTGEYPRAVFFWQQRLGWASSVNRPLTLWLSQSANFESLAASKPPKDDDGIEVTMAGQRQNAIAWVEGDRQLCIGTAGGEWTLAGQDDGALTPSNPMFVQHGSRGSADVTAVRAGSSLMFVQRGGRVVREFAYSFQRDGYEAQDVTLLTGVMAGRGVKAWAYQQEPHSVLWCVLDDGTMAGLTYLREHDVVGWHRHDTDGRIEHAACIPGLDGDELWLVVRREVNGQTRRYIERMDPFFDQPTPENAFFVDAGMTYEGPDVTELAGLDHLEGRTVAIFADGAVQPRRAVSGGVVTLDRPAAVVHVGLPYVSDIIPTRPEIPAENGTTLTRVRKISKATLRLYQSMGVLAGADEDHLHDVIGHDAADPAPPAFVTRDAMVTVDGGWTETATVLVRVEDPCPMTLLAVVYDVEIGSTTNSQI